jgi:GT2 family glycosyltransferase
MNGGASLSVLLLCWNHARYLPQCIEALAKQTDRSFEIVFLDNASTDGSFELAADLLRSHDLPARLLRNGEPAAIPVNLNRLLGASTGDLVAPLSTDDWYEEGYVAAMRAAASAHPEAGWFGCNGSLYFDDTGERRPMADDEFRSGSVLLDLLEGRQPVHFVGCCYRREALQEVGGWDERMAVEDRDLFVRLAQACAVRCLPERLVYYRRSAASASANPAFMVKSFLPFFAKHRQLFGRRYHPQVGRMYALNGVLAVDRGEFRLARTYLTRALRHSPMQLTAWRGLFYLLRRVASR